MKWFSDRTPAGSPRYLRADGLVLVKPTSPAAEEQEALFEARASRFLRQRFPAASPTITGNDAESCMELVDKVWPGNGAFFPPIPGMAVSHEDGLWMIGAVTDTVFPVTPYLSGRCYRIALIPFAEQGTRRVHIACVKEIQVSAWPAGFLILDPGPQK